MLRFMAVAALLLVLAGCRGLDVNRVTDDNRNDDLGIRYYRPAPFVWLQQVTGQDKDGKPIDLGCAASIVWLPNYDEEYSIQPGKHFFGTTSVDVKLTDGWNLGESNTSDDSKWAEVLGSLATIPAAKLGAKSIEVKKEQLAPGLYRLHLACLFPKEPAAPATAKKADDAKDSRDDEWCKKHKAPDLLEPVTVAGGACSTIAAGAGGGGGDKGPAKGGGAAGGGMEKPPAKGGAAATGGATP